MSRRRVPPVVDGGTPPEAWDLEPIIGNGPGRKRNRPKVPDATRALVYERDNYRCKNCGSDQDLTIDHVKPLSKGGKNRASNMQTLCNACNLAKGNGSLGTRPSKRPAPEPQPAPSRLGWAYKVLGLTEELGDPGDS